ncbi:MAG: class I tRNA ligase family protein, partial [bacterium]|nr:class I tRNA ligase family protein [bacterium]
TRLFLEDNRLLNIDTDAISFPRATDYIKEQIAMVQTLEQKGYAYRTSDGVYFDTSRFPHYGALSHGGGSFREEAFAEIGRRVGHNQEKRHPADFALWKLSPNGTARQQEWASPWGTGFPGWHIECSAMAKALLGPELDIHTGGIDHIPVHHTNEIAQSESANEKPLSRFWMHEAFINFGDEKIAKSTGNVIYLSDITERGYSPLALRYLFLQAHYRSPLSFSWDALAAANEALGRLTKLAHKISVEAKGRMRQTDTSRRMIALLRDDLATPAALALVWQVVRDEEMTREEQLAVIDAAESVLGLSLLTPHDVLDIPQHIQALVKERELARKNGDFSKSDALRIHIEEGGYHVEDAPSGAIVTRRPG